MSHVPSSDGSPTEQADSVELGVLADRLSALADTADLMGDGPGAERFREAAAVMRLQAMDLLDP